MTVAVLVGVNASISEAADATFGTKGRVTEAGIAVGATTLQGKIRMVAITGPDKVTVTELNPDGQPNLTWGDGGKRVITVPGAPAAAPAPPTILFAGPSVVEVLGSGVLYAQFEVNQKTVVMRLTPDGLPDASWGAGGFVTAAGACGVPVDGAVVPVAAGPEVSGGFFSVARANAACPAGAVDGTIVRMFKPTGVQHTTWGSNQGADGFTLMGEVYPTSADVDSKGFLIVAGGTANSKVGLIRVNPAGAIDGAYGAASKLEFNPRDGVAFKDHGLAVQPRQFSHGYHNKQAMDVAIDSKDRAVVTLPSEQADGGLTDVLVARATPDGKLDTTFGTAGVTLVEGGSAASDWPTAVGVDDKDRPVVAGAVGPTSALQNQFLMRFTEAGALDTTFGVNGTSKTSFEPESHIPEDVAFGPGAVYVSGLRQGTNVFGGFVSKERVEGGGASGTPWPVPGCTYAAAPYPATGFTDVPTGQFYTEPIAWAKASKITTGTTASTYSPADVVTRAQMAAFLHRMAGSPAGSPAAGFTDVQSGLFYSEGVNWLKAKNITTGATATTYAPNAPVTRSQMATFLYRMSIS